MSRSLKKGPSVDEKLLKKISRFKPEGREVVKTWSRWSTVVPEMVGYTFGVHNGKDFIVVKVAEGMVGHKLGEFSPSTRFVRHGGKMQRELEAKVAADETAKVEAVKAGPAAKAPAPKK